MEFSEVFCILLSLALLQTVSGQFRYGRVSVAGNNEYVDRADIGRYLSCTTALRPCCNSSQGTWVRPDGVNVETSGRDAYQSFEEGRIDLYVTNSAMSGMYRCDIETSENEREPFYVGLYSNDEGAYTMLLLLLCNVVVFYDCRLCSNHQYVSDRSSQTASAIDLHMYINRWTCFKCPLDWTGNVFTRRCIRAQRPSHCLIYSLCE